MKKYHIEHGFSLIETMLASSIGLIAMLGITQLLVNQFQAVKSVQIAAEANNLLNVARFILGNQNSCGLNITNGNFSSNTISASSSANLNMTMSKIEDSSGIAVLVSATAPVASNISVWVSNIGVNNFTLLDATNYIYRAKMAVTITKRGTVLGGSQTRQNIDLQFQTDASGTIVACSAGILVPAALVTPAPLTLANVCTSFGGTLSGTSCTLPVAASSTVPPLYQCPYKPSGYSSSCNGQVTSSTATCSWATSCGRGGCSYVTETCPKIN